MVEYHDVEQGTDAWHQARAGKFTGSNAYKLLGPFGATEYARAIQTDFTGNFYTKRGHVLEDRAITLYEKIYQTPVSRPGFITNTDYSDCLYSPDGVAGKTLLEVKCFNEKGHMEIYDGHIPLKIMAQIQFGLMISELKTAKLIIYNPDIPEPLRAFKAINIKADHDIHNNFKRILKGVAV